MNRLSATTALAALAFAAACTDGSTAPTKTAIAPSFDHRSAGVSGGTAVYNNIPKPIPPNVPSLGYQANQTAEFGDYVRLAGTARRARSATVLMSSWSLHSDYPLMDAAGYSHPITLNIYNVITGSVPALGTLVGSVTRSFLIPWRPVADPTCPGSTAWRASDHDCYNGFAFTITFDLRSPALTLPGDLIVGIAYNTNTWGYNPIGQPGPYESLNVGLAVVPPSVGTDVEPDAVFWNTSTAAWYADGGTGGVSIFRRDWNWTPYSPAFSISAFTVATTADDCKKDGWRSLARTDGSSFKNQGDCVSDAHDGKPEHHDRDPIKVGPVAIVGAPDIGTCNNIWALDSFDKFYTLTLNDDGTYNLQVNYKKGTFVTIDGVSPGACEVTGGTTGNGNIVGAGITGRMHQEFNIPVSATTLPNRNPDCLANDGCTSADNFLNAVFGSGNYTRSPYSFEAHYEAGSNGTWFDTSVNWPLNDRGDITGTKDHGGDHRDGRGGHDE